MDLAPKSRPRPAARWSAVVRSNRVAFDSREVGAGRPVRGDARDGSTTGTVSSIAAFAAGAAGAIGLAAGRWAARPGRRRPRSARRARPRRAPDGGEDRRRHRIGREDQHQGSASAALERGPRAASTVRSRATTTTPGCRSASRGCRATSEFARARNGHEQSRRDHRADPAGPPHVALVTAIAPAHIENLGSDEAIADAKAEIFEGLEPDGIAIIPNDTTASRPADQGRAAPCRRGSSPSAAAMPTSRDPRGARREGRQPDHRRAARERADLHRVAARRSLGVERAGGAGGGRGGRRRSRGAGLALADMGGLQGPRRAASASRSRRRSAADRRKLQRQSRVDGRDAEEPRRGSDVERRIAVLGPMRELGEHGDALHAGLAPEIIAARVERLISSARKWRRSPKRLTGRSDRPRRGRRRGDAHRCWRAIAPRRRGTGQGVELGRACPAGRADGRGLRD